MKGIILGIVLAFMYATSYSQSDGEIIKISKDLELVKLSEHAYIHISYKNLPKYGRIGANGLLLVDKNKAFLFDSPWTDSLTNELYRWITDSMKLKIIGFIPNHWHDDCMGGLRFLQQHGIPSFANQMTIDIVTSKGLPIPSHGFKDSLTLKLNKKTIMCYYLGAAHSTDNIVIWIPSEQILFAGCMIKSIDTQNLGNTADGDLISYPQTIDSVRKKFPLAKIVIPGHGKAEGIELITHTKDLTISQH